MKKDIAESSENKDEVELLAFDFQQNMPVCHVPNVVSFVNATVRIEFVCLCS